MRVSGTDFGWGRRMSAVDAVLAVAVIGAMVAIAAVDARRFVIEPGLVAVLLGAGLLWQLFGAGEAVVDGGFWLPALGAALGVAAVLMQIAVARAAGRRWPLFGGDALLLGAFGWVLGPVGLGWSLVIGAACAVAHRVCLQRKRGRSFLRGYCPLAPGFTVGAVAVFVWLNAGMSLAQEDGGVGENTAPVRATESVVVEAEALPAELAAREVSVEWHEPLSFAAVVRRIAQVSGVPVEVEERPSRVAGGAVELDEPDMVQLLFKGPLAALVDEVSRRTGYEWTWREGTLVFFRYWDSEHVGGVQEVLGSWVVDKELYPTVRQVLRNWAGRVGWSVVWKAKHEYAVNANAAYSGEFLHAVDLLFGDPGIRRSLVVTAYSQNLQLVVEDAGAMRR